MTYITHHVERGLDGHITQESCERVLACLVAGRKQHRLRMPENYPSPLPHHIKGFDDRPVQGCISPGYALIITTSKGYLLSQSFHHSHSEVVESLYANSAIAVGIADSATPRAPNEVIGRTPVGYSNGVSNEIFMDRHCYIYGHGSSITEMNENIRLYLLHNLRPNPCCPEPMVYRTRAQERLMFLFRLPLYRLPSNTISDIYSTLSTVCLRLAAIGCVKITTSEGGPTGSSGGPTVALTDRGPGDENRPALRPYSGALEQFLTHTNDERRQLEAIMPFIRRDGIVVWSRQAPRMSVPSTQPDHSRIPAPFGRCLQNDTDYPFRDVEPDEEQGWNPLTFVSCLYPPYDATEAQPQASS